MYTVLFQLQDRNQIFAADKSNWTTFVDKVSEVCELCLSSATAPGRERDVKNVGTKGKRMFADWMLHYPHSSLFSLH